jgi:hypothetical protein
MDDFYTTNIPTLQHFFPQLPEVLGNLDLNIPIKAGQPLDLEH